MTRPRFFLGTIAATACALLAFGVPSHAAAGASSAFITAFGDQTRHMLNDTALAPSDREQRFHALVDENFDFPVIMRFVLGRYWDTSAADVRQEFARVFEDYVIAGNARSLNEFSGERASVTGERAEGPRDTIVATRFTHADGDAPIEIEWRVATTPDGLKITDIAVSGVSMALSYREEFGAAIEREGGQVAAIIPELRAKLTAQSAAAALQ